MQFAEILIPQKIGNRNPLLTYGIPANLNISPGMAVNVELKNKKLIGIVLNTSKIKPPFKTKPLKAIDSPEFKKPVIDEEKITLMKWMAAYYFTPLYKILKIFVPPEILKGKLSKKEDITKLDNSPNHNKNNAHILTAEQEKSLQEITQSPNRTHLIQGVTGSGKTEIYIHLAKKYLQNGQQVLILVPEISLTPQTIDYFEKKLLLTAAVIHSQKTPREKTKNWLEIWQNQKKLIIGSRSALFAPFYDLGLIVVDEEHESSYKQDQSPRYKVHKIIEKMQELNPSLKCVYGSATPTIETKHLNRENTTYLRKRIQNTAMPKIEILDMRAEFQKKNYSIFSDRLKQEIEKTLQKKEQIILFLNRRGAASSVTCRDCGNCLHCENCDTPLTYHTSTLSRAMLICHHCGKIKDPPKTCPVCGGLNIRFLGIGTQKIAEETMKNFPDARIIRADKDTTGQKNSFQKIYEDFKNHQYDILIGTQMIAKGLHLPKVQLVGVILADIGLNIPDFRSGEKNFQLLSQVAGRAGRMSKQGLVIIQTYYPENDILKFVQNHNIADFEKYEIGQRKLLKNPPFSNLTKILIENNNYREVLKISENLETALRKIVSESGLEAKVEILRYPSYFVKLNNKYRYIILIKILENRIDIHELLEKLPEEYIISPNIKIDLDPLITT